MKTAFLQYLQSELNRSRNKQTAITSCQQVFGGDINTTYRLITNEENFFIKINNAALADMLVKEKAGLELLRAANTCLTIPKPLLYGTYKHYSYLLMEYIEKGAADKAVWQQLATGVAQLHRNTQTDFGLSYNNYIGSVAQSNDFATSWAEFYTTQRIMPLIKQAYDQQKCTVADLHMAEQFCSKLSTLMPEEQPALLHGDLWSGNRMFSANGEAAIYDPAVYYGHREMDIAMTLLFGGFDKIFYQAYNEVYPLEKNWQQRIAICQLYPLLVHLLLFGASYYERVKNILRKYA